MGRIMSGRTTYFNYYSCPITKVKLYMHNARANACPICASMDGDYYCGDEGTVEPYEIIQHNHCHCSWKVDYVEGLTEYERNELLDEQSEIVAEKDQAEADIAFCKYDIEDYKEQETNHLNAEAEARYQAEAHETAAAYLNQLINEKLDLIDTLTDEAEIQENMDVVDNYMNQAEEQIRLMEEKLEEAEEEKEAAKEANRYWHNAEDELDAAEKRFVIWSDELLKVEPCLEWPLLEEAVEKITGSNVTYLI